LYRGWFGGGEIYKFDKLGVRARGHEGLRDERVSVDGQPPREAAGLTLYADDLAYAYSPPQDTGYYSLIKGRIVKEHTDDLIFKPDASKWLRSDHVRELFPRSSPA
jgi:hypothetical protein